MVGNDIVDIAQAKKDSNWQRPRFLDKIFTINEQYLIHNSKDKTEMVWRLWSMKEAAYKLCIQLNPNRFYAPRQFKCFIENDAGVVKFKNFSCYTETKTTSDYIISEASLKPSKLSSEIVKFNSLRINNQSEILRRKLILSASKLHHIIEGKLELKKDDYGIPALVVNDNKMHISLTHHGNFGAFAIA
ncbi:4'-phosphopantetheinyl transferase superfamily protein [uncultured Winogradskyella sp.]|uniref:4'-phosphopantetheinyl transferase superfamily protein n=1 Tax=uncultured Winogradskyella sp. TaxID=395353 RepID=UPI002627370B|nr:4'-phosphopantetheinyl transferase superfamily protein [uncultured Winogradskyella sp.]